MTGAGVGLGGSHARLLACRGARVVVARAIADRRGEAVPDPGWAQNQLALGKAGFIVPETVAGK